MSLIEPLLPKEEAKDQKLEKYSNDPLANLEKSIEELSVEFKSYEIDGTSDIEFRDSDPIEVTEFYDDSLDNWDIRCAATLGYKLIVGRIDGIIKVYDLNTKEETVLKGHSNAVSCLQIAVKKDFLVSGSRDKTIIIWNLETYKVEKVLKADSEVFCLAVTSGYNIYSGSLSDRVIRKWNFWDENETSTLNGHQGGISCMKISKNNHFLVTGSTDKTLRVWSIENNQELKVFNEDCGPIYQIEITEDDKYIVSLSTGQSIFIWDLDKREMIRQFKSWGLPPVDINNISKCLLFSERSRIACYNIETQTENPGIPMKRFIAAIVCSKKNNLAYCGLWNDNTLQIIDTKSSNNFAEFKDFDFTIKKMLLIGDNDEYLASIMINGKIKINEINKENIQEDIVVESALLWNGLKFTKDGKYLILKNLGLLRIWNSIENKYVFSYENENLGWIKISYDDKYFVFNDCLFIYVYSFQDMKEVAKLDLEEESDHLCISISKDNQFIAAGKVDGSIVVFDIEKRCKISTLEGLHIAISVLKITKTNEYFISADFKNNLIFWSFLEKKIIKSIHFDQKISLLELNDKYNCAVVGVKNLIEIWNFQKQIKIAKFQDVGHESPFAVISKDETYLIFPQAKGATIWSFEYMKESESDISSDYLVDSLDITRDNKYILAAGDQGYIRLWSLEEKRFIAKIDSFGFKLWFAKFLGDDKSIVAYNNEQLRIHNIEKYFDCKRTDTYAYFTSGIHDKMILLKFITLIKSPSELPWESAFADIVVNPIGYNMLHYLCIHDKVDLLSTALKNGGEIFRDKQNMSPLSYALIRSSRRCIDEILNYVIYLEDNKKQCYIIHQLRGDIPLLFSAKSIYLVPFLEVLFRRRANKDHVGFYEVNEDLPMSIFSPIYKVYASSFIGEIDIEKKESAKQKENLIQFWGSPWGYNYTVGSEESLLLLKKIDESQNENIFQTLFVQSIIREKWEYLWPAIITITIIYWLNLITMIYYIFDPSNYILSSFIVLNGVLALYEFLQFSTKPNDYVSEIWNLVDCIRMILYPMHFICSGYSNNFWTIGELIFTIFYNWKAS